MAKVKYMGPMAVVTVGGFGPHRRSQTKDYPRAAAEELVATAKRQRFDPVGWKPDQEAPGGPSGAFDGEGEPQAESGEKSSEDAAAGRQGRKKKGKE